MGEETYANGLLRFNPVFVWPPDSISFFASSTFDLQLPGDLRQYRVLIVNAMEGLMSRNILLITLVLLCSCISVFAQASAAGQSAEQGRQEATRDIKDERFIIKTWGLASSQFNDTPSSEDVYGKMLEQKYKIRYEWVGGCLIDEDTLSYANAYNQVAYAAIKAKYGPEIFENVRKEADAEYKEKYEPRAREFERKFKEALKLLPRRDN